jgi:long-chain fatty acid transport protein
MSRFDKYAGLFADQGSFDIPSTYGVGVAFTPWQWWTVALDWQQIRYAGIAAVGNSINSLFSGAPLGATDGPGFGWRNVSVFKLGTVVKVNAQWTVRAGFSDNRQPIPVSQTFFNILAPGVVEAHATAGLTWSASAADDISVSYLHAFRNRVNGAGSIPPTFGGGEANVALAEDSFGVSWSHHF